jgi:hypothetical protein
MSPETDFNFGDTLKEIGDNSAAGGRRNLEQLEEGQQGDEEG